MKAFKRKSKKAQREENPFQTMFKALDALDEDLDVMITMIDKGEPICKQGEKTAARIRIEGFFAQLEEAIQLGDLAKIVLEKMNRVRSELG